jgi:hypothetical protein
LPDEADLEKESLSIEVGKNKELGAGLNNIRS